MNRIGDGREERHQCHPEDCKDTLQKALLQKALTTIKHFYRYSKTCAQKNSQSLGKQNSNMNKTGGHKFLNEELLAIHSI